MEPLIGMIDNNNKREAKFDYYLPFMVHPALDICPFGGKKRALAHALESSSNTHCHTTLYVAASLIPFIVLG